MTFLTVISYGYLTWEWKVGIRSYAYPLLFATLYKLLDILGLDNRLMLVKYHDTCSVYFRELSISSFSFPFSFLFVIMNHLPVCQIASNQMSAVMQLISYMNLD